MCINIFIFLACATKCASCSHRVDNCVTDVHGKLCNGYNRNDRDNCACDRGFHDNQGYHVDCVGNLVYFFRFFVYIYLIFA